MNAVYSSMCGRSLVRAQKQSSKPLCCALGGVGSGVASTAGRAFCPRNTRLECAAIAVWYGTVCARIWHGVGSIPVDVGDNTRSTGHHKHVALRGGLLLPRPGQLGLHF